MPFHSGTTHPTRPTRAPLSSLVASVALTLSIVACSGDSTTEPPPDPNRAPTTSGSIPAQTAPIGQTVAVNLADYFTDPDGDALTYSATSSDPRTVGVVVSGSVATLTPIARGTATVTATATDPEGLSAQATFGVTVPNRAPVAVDTVPADTLVVGDTAQVEMSAYFEDPDGDSLTYGAESSNEATVAVSVAGSEVSIVALAAGTALVTVTATDPEDESALHTFEVTVPNRPPVPVGSLPPQTLAVGQEVALDVSRHFEDPDGDTLEYKAESTDTAIVVTVISEGVLTLEALSQGKVSVVVTATDSGGLFAQQSFDVNVPNRAPVAVGTVPADTVFVGDTAHVELAPYFDDPDGDSLVYAAQSSNAAIVSVSVAESEVSIFALAAGMAVVTVTATDPEDESAQHTFDVTVPNRPPVAVGSIPAQSLSVGQEAVLDLSRNFEDPDGDALQYEAVSGDTTVVSAVVSGSMLTLEALAPGSASIAVTATDPGDLSARQSFEVTVSGTPPVSITGTDPVVLLEGADATVFGSGFSASPDLNRVTIGGVLARVTAATSTTLSIEVPRADCLPPRRAELRIVVGDLGDARTVGVTPLSADDLELPQGWYLYTFGGNGCIHLPGDATGGDYVVGVVSASEDPSSLTSVTMTSTVGDPTVVASRTLAANSRPLAQTVEAAASLVSGTPLAISGVSANAAPRAVQELGGGRDWQPHSGIMAQNEELLRQLGRLPPTAARTEPLAFAANDTLSLFVNPTGACGSGSEVRAVVRRVGDHTVWLDDTENRGEAFSDSQLAELDAFYGTHARSVHTQYFGDLSDIDGNGKLLILMTKEVNLQDGDQSSLGGFVWFGDLYPPGACPSSNHAEIFYGRVPDPDGVHGNAWTTQQALDYYPTLLTHEIAHLVQANAAVFGGANFTTWELEGGATLSEQLVGYRLLGHRSGRNLDYDALQAGAHWYDWVSGLAAFFGHNFDDPAGGNRIVGAPEECSWMGRPDEGNSGPCTRAFRAVYDVPSLLLRYAMDRFGDEYPGGEQALMRQLSRAESKGLVSLARVGDRPPEGVLVDFYISLWLDLNGGNAHGMATWDLADIWSRFAETAQLQPDRSSSSEFRGRWSIRAGSTSFLRWLPQDQRGPTSFRVTSSSGRPVPGHISVWAYRVR